MLDKYLKIGNIIKRRVAHSFEFHALIYYMSFLSTIIHTCTHINRHTYTQKYIYIYIYMHIYMCVCIYIYIYIYNIN